MGETHLGDLSRVPKTDPLVEAYGAVDELNAVLGWARVAAACVDPRQPDGLVALARAHCAPRIWRAITSRWISLVPS